MTAKLKMTINKNNQANVEKITNDIVIQDCNLQISKDQYISMRNVCDSLSRMFISWNFLHMRPSEKISENRKIWWRYIYLALVEQRIKPFTWSRIRATRQNFKQYTEIYKEILQNPNDTELKLDLQKYEDKLSLVNVIIARKVAKLLVQNTSLNEKSFWEILPSPERSLLCEKIGFSETNKAQKSDIIEHVYNFRVGNVSFSLMNSSREILVMTVTQFISTFQPNFIENTFKLQVKIEALILEGASVEDHLVPILSSEHTYNSPAYFFKVEVEKNQRAYCINCCLESLEILYHQYAFSELKKFIDIDGWQTKHILETSLSLPKYVTVFLREKLSKRYVLNLSIKMPYLIIPELGSVQL